jgi:twitching motility protein PilI
MSNSEALNVLREIRESTFANAVALPHREEVQAQWQGLGFLVGGIRLVSKLGEVSEMMQIPRLTSLPAVKPWMKGVANIRGRLIPVIDLHEYLEVPTTLPMNQWRILVIEDEDVVAGLMVEQSLGIQHFLEDSFEESDGEGLEGIGPYVVGAFRHGGRVYHEVQLKAILRDEKFFDVSQSNHEQLQ